MFESLERCIPIWNFCDLKVYQKLKHGTRIIQIEISTFSWSQNGQYCSWPDFIKNHIEGHNRLNVRPWHFTESVGLKQDPDGKCVSFHHSLVPSNSHFFSGRAVMVLLSLTFKCLRFPTVSRNSEEFRFHTLSHFLTASFCNRTWNV